jgi:hypothetical protein
MPIESYRDLPATHADVPGVQLTGTLPSFSRSLPEIASANSARPQTRFTPHRER